MVLIAGPCVIESVELLDTVAAELVRLNKQYGLDIILAHPERYANVLDDFDLVYQMYQAGVRMQVSASDLFGGLFNKASKVAKRLLSEGLAESLVSDAHAPEHYAFYRKAIKKMLYKQKG